MSLQYRLLFAVWLAAIVIGFGRMEHYALTPGKSLAAQTDWPDGSRIQRVPGQSTLLLFAHPYCPCTRASLVQLSRVLQQAPECRAYVVFIQYATAPDGWMQTENYRQALRVPGVLIYRDAEGNEALRFHATTSGYTLLYDANGKLLFSGGITPGRGHEGDNTASKRLLTRLKQQETFPVQTPVFGCALRHESVSTENLRATKGTDYAR